MLLKIVINILRNTLIVDFVFLHFQLHRLNTVLGLHRAEQRINACRVGVAVCNRLRIGQYRLFNNLLNLFCRTDLKLSAITERMIQRFRRHKHHFACVVVRHWLVVKLLCFLAVHKILALFLVAADRRFPNIYNSYIRLCDEFIVSRYFFARKSVRRVRQIVKCAILCRQFRILRRLLRHKAGNLVHHLILCRLHRAFPDRAFRQFKRRLQLAVDLHKLVDLVLIVVVRVCSVIPLRIRSRSRTERTGCTVYQTAKRTASGALE